MSKQCLYIEQAKHLQELGVEKSNSDVFWFKYVGDEYVKLKNICKCGEFLVKTKDKTSITQKVEGCEVIPTFTLQDILDLLPATVDDDYRLYIDKGLALWTVGYVDAVSEEIYEDFRERDLIDAAYEMLCFCIENGYVKTNKED